MRLLLLGIAIAGVALLAPCWARAGELADKITTALKNNGQLKSYSIQVTTQDGTVWLDGTVRNKEQLKAALSVVADVPGVEKIHNRLKVTDIPASAADRLNAEDIARILRDSGQLKNYRIEITVKGTVVGLEGMVSCEQQEKAATAIILGIKGVDQVDSNLKVVVDTPPCTAVATDRPAEPATKPSVAPQADSNVQPASATEPTQNDSDCRVPVRTRSRRCR